MNPIRGERSSLSELAPSTFNQTFSPVLSDGIVHSVTADVNSPPSIADYRTSRKRGFDTITSSSEEWTNRTWRSDSSAEATLQWSAQQQQHVAPREIVHMLAFSESGDDDEDEDGDQDLRLLRQQHEIAVQQHQQYRSLNSTKGSSHSFLIQPRSTNRTAPLNSLPHLGYNTYQPDVVRSIFR